MTPRSTWLLAIVALLGANVVAMVVLAVIANNGTNQVIPDYYAKAAHYDDEMASSAASRALGWHVALAIADGKIEADVINAAGEALRDATIRVTGYQRAHASDRLDVTLAMTSAGHYRGVTRVHRGWYDLIAVVDASGAHYTQHLAVESR